MDMDVRAGHGLPSHSLVTVQDRMTDIERLSWTDDRVTKLKALHAEGLSASAIAKALGWISRSAVIGKLHRLGIAPTSQTMQRRLARAHDARRDRDNRLRQARKLAREERAHAKKMAMERAGIIEAPLPVVEELFIPLEDRKTVQTADDRCCHWPIGDPKHEGFHLCGKQKVKGSSYCEFHYGRSVQPLQHRLRDANEFATQRRWFNRDCLDAVAQWKVPVEHRIREPA